MQTLIKKMEGRALQEGAEMIQSGGLVAFATETVYGLGANARMEDAVKAVYAAKGRPQDNPLIVHLDTPDRLDEVCRDIPDKARILAKALMPGPLTMVLKRADTITPAVSCGLDTVAVRVPSHSGARTFLAECKVPVAAPSANTSSRPSPTEAAHVYADLAGKIPLILDGGSCRVGIESTVVDMTKEIPVLLRPGIVTYEQLVRLVGEVSVKISGGDGKVLSPGLKYKHYAPKCEMVLVRRTDTMAEVARENAVKNPVVFCFEENIQNFSGYRVKSLGRDYEEAAHRLYSLLRETENDCGLIICECPKEDGVGASLYNRMIKAAGQRIL